MTRRILQQPDGNFAVWSTVVDDFILVDASKSELEEWYVGGKAVEAHNHIQERIKSWEQGESPYRNQNSIRTYEEALEWKEILEGLEDE